MVHPFPVDQNISFFNSIPSPNREVAKEETNAMGNVNYSEMRDIGDRNPINTLWNYCNNAANLLKTSTYQLSPTTVSSTKQSTGKEYIGKSVGPGCSDMEGVSAVMKTISSSKLTQYVTNLRLWISATILQRLVIEFDKINAEFSARGFSDIKIGKVGLERLRKTAENQTISMHVPSLPMVVPFLSMSSNQDYLVQRIRELARGSGINDYRWNSSNSYDLNWDEHVTTDAAVSLESIEKVDLNLIFIAHFYRSYSICFALIWIAN